MFLAGYRRSPFIIFGLLTVINAGMFLRRTHFDYKPVVSEAQLYTAPGKEWTHFFTDFPVDAQQQAIRFTDSLLQGTDTSRQAQIIRIGSFLYRQFAPQLGKPSRQENYKDPWEMFQYYRADSTRQLWCGHLSILFNFFCLSQGIGSRMIELMKEGDHHVVNECYLPGRGKWVLVDLTYDQLLVREKDQLLGLTEFRRMQGRSDRVLQVHTSGDSDRLVRMDTGYIRNYYAKDITTFYYKSVNPDVVYSTTSKVKRYLWPDSSYYTLSEQPSVQFLFYLRQGLLAAWILCAGLLIRGMFKRRPYK